MPQIKINTLEKRHQGQSCLYRRGNTDEGQNAKKYISGPGAIRKRKAIEERRLDQNCLFQQGDNRRKDHNHGNLPWVRDPMKIVSVTITTINMAILKKRMFLGLRIIFLIIYSVILL